MITFLGPATFKCKQCGHIFNSIYTVGGFVYRTNLPSCPKCGSRNTGFKNSLRELLRKITFNAIS